MDTWRIGKRTLEFLPDGHIYLIDGIIVPSITQMLKVRFGNKYDGISQRTLDNAAQKGTEMHDAIQNWCERSEDSDLPEVRNFRFLLKQYKLTVMRNEFPVILFDGREPMAAGRIDLLLATEHGEPVLGDLKRTSTLDKDYLTYQLNLYAKAYWQSYDNAVTGLVGFHLREDRRKLVPIPLNEEYANEIINEWKKE